MISLSFNPTTRVWAQTRGPRRGEGKQGFLNPFYTLSGGGSLLRRRLPWGAGETSADVSPRAVIHAATRRRPARLVLGTNDLIIFNGPDIQTSPSGDGGADGDDWGSVHSPSWQQRARRKLLDVMLTASYTSQSAAGHFLTPRPR